MLARTRYGTGHKLQNILERKDMEKLVEVKNLSKQFHLKGDSKVKAVDQVTFDIYRQETLGIVGESGCGKTTLGRTLLGLIDKSSGEALYEGEDIHALKGKKLIDFKKKAQIILQDPYASLNPRMTVGDIIAEGIETHNLYRGKEKQQRIYELLDTVGLNKNFASRFPHEFSGGQRQRIGIARTLGVEPDFIVCDEPISALDVSIQAQIINLLMKLQEELGLTYLFIAHDLSIVRHISDRVGVMYLGSLVELVHTESLYEAPYHPYTQALLSAVPSVDLDNPMKSRRIKLKGDIPSPINLGTGCKFASRCQHKMEICQQQIPEWKEIEPNHYVACHLYNE